MNIQVEDGFIRIANKIVEHLIRSDFSGSEFRIILLVIRKTYGFNQKKASLSLGEISRESNISYNTSAKIVRKLIGMNVLVETKTPDVSSAREIMFNKNYECWSEPKGKKPLSQKGQTLYPFSSISQNEETLYPKSAKTSIPNRQKPLSQKGQTTYKDNLKTFKDSSNARARVPQLSEILSFISDNGLNVDGESFYKKYSENGWVTEKGEPITDWQRLLKIWDSRELKEKAVYQNGYAGVKSLWED